ncbi:MAG: DinB family protein, partial [Acidobacteriaceae bacterium]|nr:DinB family protein [Acidobacteriaceae bacterium]
MASDETCSEAARIADQLRQWYTGPSWLGPSMTEILADIEEDLARSQPIARTHTIWELTLHISAWLKIARERLSATENRDPTSAQNWPAIEKPWREALIELETEVRALENAILSFPDNRLEQR